MRCLAERWAVQRVWLSRTRQAQLPAEVGRARLQGLARQDERGLIPRACPIARRSVCLVGGEYIHMPPRYEQGPRWCGATVVLGDGAGGCGATDGATCGSCADQFEKRSQTCAD